MTTATFPRRIMRPIASAPDRRSFAAGFGLALALGLLAIAGLAVAIGAVAGDRVLGGVSVEGVSLAGLDRAAAEERLAAKLPPVSSGRAAVVAGETEVSVAFEDLGRAYDLDAMLDAALAVGRAGTPWDVGLDRLRSLAHPTAIGVEVTAYDPTALERLATRVADTVSQLPVQAWVEPGTFAVHPSTDGRVLEAGAVEAALAGALATTSPADVRVELAVTPVAARVSTAQAQRAADVASATAADLALTVPNAAPDEAPLTLPGSEIASWISFSLAEAGGLAMEVDAADAAAAVAELAGAVDRDPVDAVFTVAGAGLGGVVAAQDGRALDATASTELLLAALDERAAGAAVPSLALAVDVTEPALTTVEAEALLPQMQLLSSWTTYYTAGDGNGFGNNISIGAWDLDGYNLAPGEWLSFWDGIGPVTVERGYSYGGAIINGRSVANGALAGGICSTSTTLFNAAMRLGLEIGERTAHYYYIERYPTGLDATVSIYGDWVTDMTFRNDTEYPIVIRGFGSPGVVTFQMWSVPNGRTVVLSDPLITDRRSAGDTTQLDPSMAPGTARRVEWPHHGFKVTVSRTVYAADGSIVHQNTWFSDYRAVDGVTLVGPTPAPAPKPPPDEDEAAPPDADA